MPVASKQVVSVARVIAESKLRRKVDFNKMHPRERDFWMARGQQALSGEAHGWAVAEAGRYT